MESQRLMVIVAPTFLYSAAVQIKKKNYALICTEAFFSHQ